MSSICPFPEFIGLVSTATSVLLTIIREELEDEDSICPMYPAQYVCFAILMLLQVHCAAKNIPLRVAIRQLFPTIPSQPEEFWPRLARQPVRFWELTGETPGSLARVVHRISHEVQSFIRDSRNPRQRLIQTRPFVLSTRDRILMLFVWLRNYPTFSNLGSLFGVSATTAAENVHILLLITLFNYEPLYIRWHPSRVWNYLRGSIDDFPDVVGMIDATPIRINRPQGNAQRLYYRGDRGFHFVNWQVVVDTNGFFAYGQAGFLGHLTDAASYGMLPRIGFGNNCPLQLPINSYLMADSGYPTGYPLLVPFSRRGGRRLTANMEMFNRALSRHRVRVEHRIGDLKIYRCVSSRFRHKRWRISGVANLVMALTNRRRKLINNIRRNAVHIV